MKKRLKGDVRKEQIIQTALQLVLEHGFNDPKLRVRIAEKLNIWRTLVVHYFPKEELLDEIMRRAIAAQNLRTIAEGIMSQHHLAIKAPNKIKHKALNYWAKELMGQS
jgi:AcrR family transcriptional regulator